MIYTRPRLIVLPLIALCCVALAQPAAAMFMQPQLVPAERLIKNLNAYIKQNPQDAQAHFLLGRVHYMAFVNRVAELPSNNIGSAEKLPRVQDPRQWWRKDEAKKIDDAAAAAHANTAIAAYKKAIELDEDNALYHLGLAGVYQQSAGMAEDVHPAKDKPENIRKRFRTSALKHNLTAYQLDREKALKEDSVFLPFYPVAYEAGKAYLGLIDKHGLQPESKELVEQIKADMKSIDSKPKAITPIVMRIDGDTPRSLDDLLATNQTVRFDLDADGTPEPRAWVKPGTALLVWDPKQTGRITSGKQLFGNMTFFMLFSDGYRAMDALDDNLDGRLAGDELQGLALWHDRNTNGVSDPGEVTPIGKTAIQSISTRATGKHGIHPMNGTGVTLKDGTTRPTWDWIIPASD